MNDLIEWPRAQYWDKCWNPIIGCNQCSPACDNCYAAALARRFKMSFIPHRTTQRVPTKGVVFCGNMTDLFGEWVGFGEQMGFLSELWHFDDTPHSSAKPNDATYLFLTKRPKRMLEACCNYAEIPHAFFGYTAENQEMYDSRDTDFCQNRTDKIKWWISCEPLLGPISFMFGGDGTPSWVVVGCESGPNRRACKIEWVREIVQQCQSFNVPVFVKQLDIDGKCVTDINKFPKDLRIRQVPLEKK